MILWFFSTAFCYNKCGVFYVSFVPTMLMFQPATSVLYRDIILGHELKRLEMLLKQWRTFSKCQLLSIFFVCLYPFRNLFAVNTVAAKCCGDLRMLILPQLEYHSSPFKPLRFDSWATAASYNALTAWIACIPHIAILLIILLLFMHFYFTFIHFAMLVFERQYILGIKPTCGRKIN